MKTVFDRLSAFAEIRLNSAYSSEELLPDLRWADAVLMWWVEITEEMLDECPNLKFVGKLDVSQTVAKVLLGRNIPVSVSRRGFSPAVAEMALTLILASLRRTSNHHSAMWRGDEKWIANFPGDIDPHERHLTGRRVGIVGFGGIGQRLAQLLAPFECEIQIYDPYLPAEVAKNFNATQTSLETLASSSEILVICAAANPGTKSLIDSQLIESLPAHSIFVNVCRASLVDTQALLARLQRGDLYAAIDVFDAEPLPLDSPFRLLPNVYLTPHRAGGTIQTARRILDFVIDDLEAFLKGEPRKHALTEAMIGSLDSK